MKRSGRRATLLLVAAGVVAAAGVAAYVVFASRPGPNRVDADDPQLIAEGERLYAEYCASCHGAELEGQPDWRTALPTGGLPAPPHDDTGHTWHHPDQQLFELTKFGGQPFAPPGFQSNMPAFDARLTDRQIRATLAYIKSRWPPDIRDRQRRISERAR